MSPARATATESPSETQQPPEAAQPEREVIVKEKPKKKRYTRSLRAIQRLEVGVSKSNRRMAEAVVRGLDTWIDATKQSSRKKRDGAIKDGVKNLSKAMRETLVTASEAPADFLDEVAKIGRVF